mgnify:CR=1 FL=1
MSQKNSKVWRVVGLVLMTIATGVGMRGKGGGFVEWGITKLGKNNHAHGLGALIVASALCLMMKDVPWILAYLPAFAAGWFFYTKPTPHLQFRTIDSPTAKDRAEAIIFAGIRGACVIPLLLVIYYASHGWPVGLIRIATLSVFCILSAYILVMPYYIGGLLQWSGKARDAVEVGEWGTCVAAPLFYVVAYVLP